MIIVKAELDQVEKIVNIIIYVVNCILLEIVH